MKTKVADIVQFVCRINRSHPAGITSIPDLPGVCEALSKMAKSLHGLGESYCTHGLTMVQGTREENLKKKTIELAQSIGFGVYFQGDPHGAPVYLIPHGVTREQAASEYYSVGICVPY